jgi:hypothetical protein
VGDGWWRAVQWHVLLVEVHTLQLYQLEEGTEGRLRVDVTCALQRGKSEWLDHTVGTPPLEGDVFAQVHRGFVIPLKLPVDWYVPLHQPPPAKTPRLAPPPLPLLACCPPSDGAGCSRRPPTSPPSGQACLLHR